MFIEMVYRHISYGDYTIIGARLSNKFTLLLPSPARFVITSCRYAPQDDIEGHNIFVPLNVNSASF